MVAEKPLDCQQDFGLLTKFLLTNILFERYNDKSYRKSYDKNKYIFVEQTESYRLMRGAWEAYMEYIFELCTERFSSRLQRVGIRYICLSVVRHSLRQGM